MNPLKSCHVTKFLSIDNENIKKHGINKLSAELINLCKELCPDEKEILYRNECIQKIIKALEPKMVNYKIHLLESYQNSAYYEDIIFVIVSLQSTKIESTKNNDKILHEIKTILRNADFIDHKSVIYAEKCENPYIKCSDIMNCTNIKFYYNDTKLIERDAYVTKQIANIPNTRFLFIILKHFIKLRKLDSDYNGLKPYYLFLMIIHFLCLHPINKYVKDYKNMGPLLMDFFQFYGLVYSFNRTSLNIKKITYVKNIENKSVLAIIDPINNKKIGSNCKIIHLVQYAFAHCYKIMNCTFKYKIKNTKVLSILWFPVDLENNRKVMKDDLLINNNISVENLKL